MAISGRRGAREFKAIVASRGEPELLNETLFFSLDTARQHLARWVADYNGRRPHSACGYQTPAAYAARLTATGGRLNGCARARRRLA